MCKRAQETYFELISHSAKNVAWFIVPTLPRDLVFNSGIVKS